MKRLPPLALVVCVSLVSQAGALGGSLKGDGPTVIAAGGGAVWIGSGNGSVLRLEPRTGRVTGRFLDEVHQSWRWPGYVGSIAVGASDVWVADRREFLKRIDLRTGSVRVLRHGGRTADLVAVAGRTVWAGDFERNSVSRVDPRRNRVVATLRVPGRLFGLAAGRAGAWVVVEPTAGAVSGPRGQRDIYRLAPRARLVRVGLRLRCDPGLAVGRLAFWIVDQCSGRLLRAGRDGRVARSVRIPRGKIPVLGLRSVWLVGGTRVVRIDPQTLAPVAEIAARGAAAAVGRDALWVLDHGDGRTGVVRKIDPRTNRVVASLTIRP